MADLDPPPSAQATKKPKNSHDIEPVAEQELDQGNDTLPDADNEDPSNSLPESDTRPQSEEPDADSDGPADIGASMQQEDSEEEYFEDARPIAALRPATTRSTSEVVVDSEDEDMDITISSQVGPEDDDTYPDFKPEKCGANGVRPVPYRPIPEASDDAPPNLDDPTWREGAALPVGYYSPWFEAPSEFERKVSIGKGEVATLVAEFGKENKSRLPHCTMLAAAAGSQLQTAPVVAGVLGFPNVPQFTTWLHRDGKCVSGAAGVFNP